MIRFLLKIWPALTPIIIYCLWLLIKKMINKNANKKVIDATYFEEKNNQNTQNFKKVDQNKPEVGNFSLNNKQFIIVLYLSFFIAIICFLFFAIRVPKIENGNYIPAHIENGQIIPAKIIK